MTNPIVTGSLRLLNAFASSELAERYRLHEPAKKIIARGTKLGAELLSRAAERAKRARQGEDSPADRFDLTPTEPQELIRASMRRFAERTLRPAAAQADDALGPPAHVIEQASTLGLSALAIPEAFGGAAEERSPVTWALIAEELARGDMGLAAALLAPVGAAHLIVDHATDEQKRALLPPLLEAPASAALLEPGTLFDPRHLHTRAREVRRGYKIRGEKALVLLGLSSRFFVVSAELKGKGPRLFVLERDRVGLEVEPAPAMGLRAGGACTLRFDVEVPKSALLGGEEMDHARVTDLGRLAWGALAVGQCQAVLEHVSRYCNERIAFGEPITNRQSVAFLIADIAIELEAMRLMVWRAAARAERGKRITGAAHLVRVQCAEHAMKIGTDGVQLLGGAGFLCEHPVERWYRHLRATAVMEGGLSL